MLCTPAFRLTKTLPPPPSLICPSIYLPAYLFLVIKRTFLLDAVETMHGMFTRLWIHGAGEGRGGEGRDFCYYFSFDENMYIVQNIYIYMKYKLYMVWEAGMWWSITTYRNVTLVLQFLWFHDMLLWTANKRPEFKPYEGRFYSFCLIWVWMVRNCCACTKSFSLMTKYLQNECCSPRSCCVYICSATV